MSYSFSGFQRLERITEELPIGRAVRMLHLAALHADETGPARFILERAAFHLIDCTAWAHLPGSSVPE